MKALLVHILERLLMGLNGSVSLRANVWTDWRGRPVSADELDRRGIRAVFSDAGVAMGWEIGDVTRVNNESPTSSKRRPRR